MSEGETEAREGASDDAVEEERNDEIDVLIHVGIQGEAFGKHHKDELADYRRRVVRSQINAIARNQTAL